MGGGLSGFILFFYLFIFFSFSAAVVVEERF